MVCGGQNSSHNNLTSDAEDGNMKMLFACNRHTRGTLVHDWDNMKVLILRCLQAMKHFVKFLDFINLASEMMSSNIIKILGLFTIPSFSIMVCCVSMMWSRTFVSNRLNTRFLGKLRYCGKSSVPAVGLNRNVRSKYLAKNCGRVNRLIIKLDLPDPDLPLNITADA